MVITVSMSYPSTHVSSLVITFRVYFTLPCNCLIQQSVFDFGGNPTHVEITFQNTLAWPKWYPQHVYKFTDNYSSDFEEKFILSLDQNLLPFCSSTDVSRQFWIWKITQKHVFFTLDDLQKLLPTFQNFSWNFPRNEENFYADMRLKSDTFYVPQNRKWNTHKHTHTLTLHFVDPLVSPDTGYETCQRM